MACLTRAESSSCSTGGTLASLYRAGSGVVFHTGKHPLRAWLTTFWIRLMECWRPVRTWRNCPPFLTNEDLVRPGYHTSEANRAFGITTAFIAFVIAAGGAPECTLLSPRIWLATLLAAAAFSATWRWKFSLGSSQTPSHLIAGSASTSLEP